MPLLRHLTLSGVYHFYPAWCLLVAPTLPPPADGILPPSSGLGEQKQTKVTGCHMLWRARGRTLTRGLLISQISLLQSVRSKYSQQESIKRSTRRSGLQKNSLLKHRGTHQEEPLLLVIIQDIKPNCSKGIGFSARPKWSLSDQDEVLPVPCVPNQGTQSFHPGLWCSTQLQELGVCEAHPQCALPQWHCFPGLCATWRAREDSTFHASQKGQPGHYLPLWWETMKLRWRLYVGRAFAYETANIILG